MAKKNQVRRYGYEWGGQRKQWWQKTTTTILVIAVAAGIGWFAYEPAYNFIMNMGGNLHTATTPPPSSAAAEPTPPTPPTAPAPAPSTSPVPSTSLPVATPPPEQVRSGLPTKTYYLSAQTLQSKEQLAIALDGIKAKGGNGVMFDLKNDRGEVLYDSALPIVAKNLALAEQPYSLAETLEAIRAAGLAPVGRIFAFKDSTSTASLTEGAVKYMNSKVNWLDNAKASGGKSWLNPNSAVARDYILELVDEAAAAGVSCLVLDGVQFPDGLSLHLATYGGIPDKSAVLADFVRSAQQRAEKNGVKVYPVVMLSAAAGINDLPYGENPAKVMSAAGQAILDVRPEQFGLGVTTDKLLLSKPVLSPYDTTKIALGAAEASVTQEGVELAALVQAYTSTQVEGAANKTYGEAEVAEQIKAAAEAGIDKAICYNPSGSY